MSGIPGLQPGIPLGVTVIGQSRTRRNVRCRRSIPLIACVAGKCFDAFSRNAGLLRDYRPDLDRPILVRPSATATKEIRSSHRHRADEIEHARSLGHCV